MTINYFHHSGRFDRSPELLVMGFHNDRMHGAEVIAFTEVANPHRSQALHTAATNNGWEVFQATGWGLDECAIAFKSSRFVLVAGWADVLSDIQTFSTTGHKRSPFAATFAVLKEKATGEHFIFSTAHTPSHVQSGGTWTKINRVRQYQQGSIKWNRLIKKYSRVYNAHKIVSMDSNLDVRQAWVRAYLKTTYPSLHLLRDAEFVGTHGVRVIDLVLVGSRLDKQGKIEVYPTRDSDHRTVAVKIVTV